MNADDLSALERTLTAEGADAAIDRLCSRLRADKDYSGQRYGICSAITTFGGQDLPHSAEDRQYCIRALVRALHQELRERLTVEIERHEGKAPAEASQPPHTAGVLTDLMRGRDWLFADDL